MRTGSFSISLIVAILLSVMCHSRSSGAERPPNIVLILADDLGYGDVSCYNDQAAVKTPHIDRLAHQGMLFTDAHSPATVCTPTRYSLMTGQMAFRVPNGGTVFTGVGGPSLITPDRLTLAEMLRERGYSTACVGKWHLGFQSNAEAAKSSEKSGMGSGGLPVGAQIVGGPTTRGFDLFWGCSNARTMSALIEGDRVIESIRPVDMLPRLGQQAASVIQKRAVEAKAGKPFFLYVPLTSPHTPIVPSPEWQGKSDLGKYGDFVMMTDAIVGQILAALDDAGLTENTLVIFTADNGCSPAADTTELEKQGHFASAQFRGYKADIWEGGHRVPFFVRWPMRIKPGTHSQQVICHTDFMATCAALLEIPLADSVAEDSVSILPALLGTDTAPLREAVVHHSINGRFAIRQGPWKLCLCASSGGWGKPSDAEATEQGLPGRQLYDLRQDPAETTNLITAQPVIASKLLALLERYVADGRSTPGAVQANDVKVGYLPEAPNNAKKKAKRKAETATN